MTPRCDVCWHIARTRAITDLTTTEDEYLSIHHLIHGALPLPDQNCDTCGEYLLDPTSPGYEPHTCQEPPQ